MWLVLSLLGLINEWILHTDESLYNPTLISDCTLLLPVTRAGLFYGAIGAITYAERNIIGQFNVTFMLKGLLVLGVMYQTIIYVFSYLVKDIVVLGGIGLLCIICRETKKEIGREVLH